MSTTHTATAVPVHPFDTTPEPERHATYPGDKRRMVGTVFGHEAYGPAVTAVTATYDPDADRTRVGFAYGAHDLRPVMYVAPLGAVYAAPVGTDPTDVGAFNPIGRLVEVTQ